MKTLLAIAALMMLGGCQFLAGITPSLQYCSEVKYERRGNQITLEARCAAPIGGSGGLGL